MPDGLRFKRPRNYAAVVNADRDCSSAVSMTFNKLSGVRRRQSHMQYKSLFHHTMVAKKEIKK